MHFKILYQLKITQLKISQEDEASVKIKYDDTHAGLLYLEWTQANPSVPLKAVIGPRRLM